MFKIMDLYVFLSVVCHVLLVIAGESILVQVDPLDGDDERCLSVGELAREGRLESPFPCLTINRALDDNVTDYYDADNCSQSLPNVSYSDVRVSLYPGLHALLYQLQLISFQNLTIISEPLHSATIACSDFSNSTDVNIDNIFACGIASLHIEGVIFERCGPLSSNLYIHNSSQVRIVSSIFRNNKGSPLQVRYVDKLTMLNTVFTNNTNENMISTVQTIDLTSPLQSTGGMALIGGLDRMEVLINDCTFNHNRASINNRHSTQFNPNGFGGAIKIHLIGTHRSLLIVNNSRFIGNMASQEGGAIYLSYSDTSIENEIVINNCIFNDNQVSAAAGGAISINSFRETFSNSFIIRDSTFTNNTANSGGAVSITLYESTKDTAEYFDIISFVSCTFNRNIAHNEGTAVGLVSLVYVDQSGFQIKFIDCHFEGNIPFRSTDNPVQLSSSVSSYRLFIQFSGTNVFLSNIGGAITLVKTRMLASGTLLFEENTAVFGPGIKMFDLSLLSVLPHTHITFSNNEAAESGGAIFVNIPPVNFVINIFNRLCFLQYQDQEDPDVLPQDWKNVSINFVNNTAGTSGGAIYASDMKRCGWLGDNYTTSNTIIFRPPRGLKSPFHFNNNVIKRDRDAKIVSRDLGTDAEYINLYTDGIQVVQPGELLNLELVTLDQLENSREAVWSLRVNNEDSLINAASSEVNETFTYVVPYFNSTLNMSISLLSTLGVGSRNNLSVNLCHPGYIMVDETCNCDTEYYEELLRCDQNKRYLYLRDGVWGGVDEYDNTLVTARVLPGYLSCEKQRGLPGCLFEFDSPDEQCREGRRGTLCGKCDEDRGVTLDLQSCSPFDCTIGLVLFILVCCVFPFVYSFLVLWYNIAIPKELMGLIFYFQVIGLVYRPFSVENTSPNEIDAIGVIVNALGFSVPIPFCISKTIGAEYIALLHYIPPLIIVTMVQIFVIGARFIKSFAHHSAIKGIATLQYWFYKYLADTAFIFLSCTHTPIGFLFQYDGTVECFSPYFGVFFVLNLLIIIIYIFPLPFGVMYICSSIRSPQHFKPFADVLTDGIKPNRRLWCGWEIGRRLPFIVISLLSVVGRPSFILFFMSMGSITVFLVHILVKPYENEKINIIESLILIDLIAVTAAFSNLRTPELGYVLMFVPYLYGIGWVCYKVFKLIKKKIIKIETVNKEEQVVPKESEVQTPGYTTTVISITDIDDQTSTAITDDRTIDDSISNVTSNPSDDNTGGSNTGGTTASSTTAGGATGSGSTSKTISIAGITLRRTTATTTTDTNSSSSTAVVREAYDKETSVALREPLFDDFDDNEVFCKSR